MTSTHMNLLPEPKKIGLRGSHFTFPGLLRINSTGPVNGPPATVIKHIEALLARPDSIDSTWPLTLSSEGRGPEDGYRLTIGRKGGRILGNGDAGLFYGLHTLRQLIELHGRHLPACQIIDQPSFATRGVYLDVTRGKVPKLSTVKRLIDRMSELKMNHLQLYVEHVFDFPFDPEIGAGCAPLTADDIRELDSYCRERFIEFVPSLACFGHMGRILSLPAYRGLAEVEWDAPDWAHAPWRKRLAGVTIDPRNPRARELLTRMIDAFLPCFTAASFNICGDETYDLGKGKNRAYAARYGIEKLYLDHIRFLRKQAARHGKQLMFWGDIMLKHTEAIPQIPRDCTVLDWGYSPQTNFNKCRHFLRAGLKTFVCPSTRGHQVVFNQVEEARANISGYAKAGYRAGADGLLVTDWGDMGHFNMRTCSLHGIALGAALGWNARGDSRRSFDRAFARHVLGSRQTDASSFYSLAADNKVSSWPFMLDPLTLRTRDIPTRPQAYAAIKSMRSAERLMSCPDFAPALEDAEREELRLGCAATALNAEKILIYRALTDGSHTNGAMHQRLLAFANDLDKFTSEYVSTWIRENRRSGSDEIRRALKTVTAAARNTSEDI